MEKLFKKFQIYLIIIIFVINIEKIKSQVFCSYDDINGETIQPICEYNRQRIPCDMPLVVGTRVTIHCQIGYMLPNRRIKEVLICTEDGKWDFEPFQCEVSCGVQPQISVLDNQRYPIVPWYVLISKEENNLSYQVSTGTIISERIVLSVAHVFSVTGKHGDKVFKNKDNFHVEIGKHQKRLLPYQAMPVQVFNLTELYVGSNETEINPIAILVLNNAIKFDSFIKPACVEWQSFENQSPKLKTFGRIAGWDLTLEQKYVITENKFEIINREECVAKLPEYVHDYFHYNKTFCVESRDQDDKCRYVEGSGFIIPQNFNGIKRYYLWGILYYIKNEITQSTDCVAIMTNIQLYSSDINEYVTKYSVK